ncbi:hypothetical protein KR074_007111, partial [Drosophila pseudoananassae]
LKLVKMEERLKQTYQRHCLERERITRRLKRLTGKRSIDLLCKDSTAPPIAITMAALSSPSRMKGGQQMGSLETPLPQQRQVPPTPPSRPCSSPISVARKRSPRKASRHVAKTTPDLLVVGHQLPMHAPPQSRRIPLPRQPVDDYIYFYPGHYPEMIYWHPQGMLFQPEQPHQILVKDEEPPRVVDKRFIAELVDGLILEAQEST